MNCYKRDTKTACQFYACCLYGKAYLYEEKLYFHRCNWMLIERKLKRVVSKSETKFGETLNLIIKSWFLFIITLEYTAFRQPRKRLCSTKQKISLI